MKFKAMHSFPEVRIISEQESPLFRIMWVSDAADASRRHFDNNISAFHIGGGYVMSVAHNLRSENPLVRTFPENIFSEQLLPRLNAHQQAHFIKCYQPDLSGTKRHLTVSDPALLSGLTEGIKSSGFDCRWVSLSSNGISVPKLIVQFRNNAFYGEDKLADLFNSQDRFYEPGLKRHTFLLSLELVKAFYEYDIALYRIQTDYPEIISALPSIAPDFSLLNERELDSGLYCLQSSPAGYLGRLLNKAVLEGYLDQYQVFQDAVEGNYILEGFRYLIRGYFRFGSSGAPYLTYDGPAGCFKVNAIQSEASPVQLSINNNREGNYQYVNAIASPLFLVKNEIEALTGLSF